MAKYQKVFQRKEIKYLLDGATYLRVRDLLEGHMLPDKYGKHAICNLYYDTKHYDLIAKSVEKPPFKQKLRIRSYGVPNADGLVFLELKKKYKGIVYKRRVSLPLKEAMEAVRTGVVPLLEKDSNAREIEGFLRFHRMERATFLAYDRVALFCPEDKNLRMTFDTNLRFRKTDLDLSLGDHGTVFPKEDFYIWEIKAQDALPRWLTEILRTERIYPGSFSKYGYLYTQHLLTKE